MKEDLLKLALTFAFLGFSPGLLLGLWLGPHLSGWGDEEE